MGNADTVSSIKNTVDNELVSFRILDWRMFEILDTLHQTATGVGAPFFAAPLATLMNLSSVIPHTVDISLYSSHRPNTLLNRTLQVQTNFNHLS